MLPALSGRKANEGGCLLDLRATRKIARLSQFSLAQRSRVPRMRLNLAECGVIELQPIELEAIRAVLRAEIEQRASKLRDTLSDLLAAARS